MDAHQFACFSANSHKHYNMKFKLQRHISYICHYCRKRIPSKQSSREHGYIHTNEKPFQCRFSACSKRSSQLAAHHKTHEKKGGSTKLADLTPETQQKGIKLPLPPALLELVASTNQT